MSENPQAGLSPYLTSSASLPLHKPCALASGIPSLSCLWTLLFSVLQGSLSWYCHLARTKPFLWHDSDGLFIMVFPAPPFRLLFPVLYRSLGTLSTLSGLVLQLDCEAPLATSLYYSSTQEVFSK